MISETKLDDSFPEAQFYMESFRTPFRLDRSKHGGGIHSFVAPLKLGGSCFLNLDKEGVMKKFLRNRGVG